MRSDTGRVLIDHQDGGKACYGHQDEAKESDC